MINRILVPYDGSDQSDKAFAFALDMASKYSAQMIVLSVARPQEPPVAIETEGVLDSAEEYYEGHFKTMHEKAKSLGIEPKFQVLAGHPAAQILYLAGEEEIDAIVMGHRGESFMQRWLLGSVAKRVLTYASCMVIVVR